MRVCFACIIGIPKLVAEMSTVLAGCRVLDSPATTPTTTPTSARAETKLMTTMIADSKPAATLTADQVMSWRKILTQISLITSFPTAVNCTLCLIASVTVKYRKASLKRLRD